MRPIWILGRAFALALGLMLAANLLGSAVAPRFDATLFALDMRHLPAWLGIPVRFVASVLLIGFALFPPTGGLRRCATTVAVTGITAIAAADAVNYQRLLSSGALAGGLPIAFSWLTAGGLLLILILLRPGMTAASPSHKPRADLWLVGGVAICLVPAFLLGQIMTFGRTDYRRPADAIIVFGARCYADGRPSSALSDRMIAAAELYHKQFAPRLILSGGPGDGAVHETDAMRTLAIQLGVPANAIAVDRRGVNTEATVRATPGLIAAGESRTPRVLAVSHFYHLPRIKLAYQRAGIDAYTVPATQQRPLRKLPYFVAREVAALAAYFVKPLL